MKLVIFLCCAVVAVLGQTPGQTITIQITSGGRQRTFDLFTPSGYNGQPAPLLLNFHGWGSNAVEERLYTLTNTYGNSYGWIVAYPQGIGASFNGGACCGVAADQRIDDVQFARDVVAQISAELNVRPDAIFTTGMSNGGYISHRIACEAADLFSGAAPNASRRAFGADFLVCNPARPIHVFSVTGTADPLVPYLGGGVPSYAADLANRLAVNGCNPNAGTILNITSSSYCEFFAQGTACAGPDVEFCTVNGGVHVWFFGPADIDTSAYLFQRFAQQIGQQPIRDEDIDGLKEAMALRDSLPPLSIKN